MAIWKKTDFTRSITIQTAKNRLFPAVFTDNNNKIESFINITTECPNLYRDF